MKQSDDSRHPEAQFPVYSEETEGNFLGKSVNSLKHQAVERSFETQSGYLVLIKQFGNRYALSFKRQIGTPPSSSIFLTADEGQRLANIFRSENFLQENFHSVADDWKNNMSSIQALKKGPRKSSFFMPTLIFLVSIALWVILVMLVYQMQLPPGHL